MDDIKKALGQLFVIGFEGQMPDTDLKALIRKYQPGGVILFKRNLDHPEQIHDLTKSLQEASPDQPLMIMIDQEGGRVWRFPSEFTFFPEASALGMSGLDSLAYAASRVIAQELIAVGINCNFAPVLDLNTNPANPVIGDRCLGTEPPEVARLARTILLSFREHGIAGCGKHFPGHGDTDLDSHLSLPTVNHDRKRLFSLEMAPYEILLNDPRSPLELIMTAHLLIPDLDPVRPATLSRGILHGILRRRLGFQGLIVTDDLEMGAITESYAAEEAALLAFGAGADLLLFCHTPSHLPACINALDQALKQNHISYGRLKRSLRRIKSFKKRLQQRLPPEAIREVLFHDIGCEAHQRIAQRVVASAKAGLPTY